jgi:hypothetical protein
MTAEFMIGLKDGGQNEVITVDAEDALIAALRAKLHKPSASINYVRRRNRRGDRRHPHLKVTGEME